MDMKKLDFALVSGHILECFDNTLYGFFAVILSPLFFPSHSPTASLLATYGAFAAGFLARPFGAIFLGHLGDIKGRRKPLLWSMMLVGIPTFIIGILPTYDIIGIAAPIMLVLCRLTQGFFFGAEFSGAAIYVSENFEPNVLGSKTGTLISLGITGAIFATLAGALVTSDVFPFWAWRIPFIFGGTFAFILYFVRRRFLETTVFEQEVKNKNAILSRPLKILIQHHKKDIILSAIIAGSTIVPLYVATIFGNKIFRELGYSPSQSMLMNTVGMIVDAIFVAYFGYIADKIGFYREMIWGSVLTIIVAIPSFYLISGNDVSTLNILTFIITLVGVGCIINGCAVAYITTIFPPNCRYSGTALSITLGHAIIAGLTPLIATYLTDLLGTRMAPALWVIFISLLTLIGVFVTKQPKYLTQQISAR